VLIVSYENILCRLQTAISAKSVVSLKFVPASFISVLGKSPDLQMNVALLPSDSLKPERTNEREEKVEGE
jgi:hypothetical protein